MVQSDGGDAPRRQHGAIALTGVIRGRVMRIGDGIDTDLLAPGRYMKAPIAELASHCLEAIDPGFAGRVRPGDILVAGRNLGMGSSREQAVQALLTLGFAAVLARSVARIFYRNALNLGLPVSACGAVEAIEEGMVVALDPRAGTVELPDGRVLACEPIPDHLMAMVEAGGVMPYLEAKLRPAS